MNLTFMSNPTLHLACKKWKAKHVQHQVEGSYLIRGFTQDVSYYLVSGSETDFPM